MSEADERAQAFFADASHELRPPLAVTPDWTPTRSATSHAMATQCFPNKGRDLHLPP